MCDQARKDRLSRRRNKGVAVNYCNRQLRIRAPLGRALELQTTAGSLALSCHISTAVMLSTSAAAGRQIRLTLGSQGEERLDKRQAEQNQQRDGEKFPQCLY